MRLYQYALPHLNVLSLCVCVLCCIPPHIHAFTYSMIRYYGDHNILAVTSVTFSDIFRQEHWYVLFTDAPRYVEDLQASWTPCVSIVLDSSVDFWLRVILSSSSHWFLELNLIKVLTSLNIICKFFGFRDSCIVRNEVYQHHQVSQVFSIIVKLHYQSQSHYYIVLSKINRNSTCDIVRTIDIL